MMIMVNTDCPAVAVAKSVDILIRDLTEHPAPDGVTTIGFYSYWGGQGIISHVVYEIEDGKVDNGIKWITESLLKYTVLDGFKSEVRVCTPIEQSVAFLGKEVPTV
jgi:hypothetical protein